MNIENATTEEHKSLTVAFELVDQRPSSFIQDGPGIHDDLDKIEDYNPAISFPSYRIIKNVSRMKVRVPAKDGRPETFRYKKIRYIQGCPTIDMDEQIANKVEKNYLADVIIFRAGHLTVTNEGDTALFDYLTQCEYNVDAPGRPDDAQDVFKALDPVKDAAGEEQAIDLEFAVMDVLGGLKSKGSKAGSYKYNEDTLAFYCQLFKLPAFESGYESEAWVALAKFAKENPAKFINSIAQAKTLFEQDVLAAKSLGVVTIDRSRAYLTNGNVLLMNFDNENATEEEKVSELIDFMANPVNKKHYENLRVMVRTAKNKSVGTVS